MIDTQPFGTTGHQSSRVIFGAAALGGMSQGRADATIETVRAHHINHFDTAASYGESELRLTDFLADHRRDVFLATKTGSRTASEARAELELSLERLGVRHVDLIQLHNLVEEADWLTAFSPGGAVEALFKARDEGLCRHVGITGHGLRIAQMHVRSLAEAPFASVLFPWNHVLAQNADYAADVAMLNEVCETYGVARQTIKSIARRRWDSWDQAKYSWYQPLEDAAAIGRAVEFVLSDERYFLNTSSDARLLQAALDAAGAHDGSCPSEDALEQDRAEFEMLPLFDGEALEVIR
jgi:aryl-alcohol dehydrogenase-like predicted oxidoreductase